MFNAPLPAIEDLPSAAQLRRSTLVSAGVALTLLVTVLLPAEYAIDPTRIGRAQGARWRWRYACAVAAPRAQPHR